MRLKALVEINALLFTALKSHFFKKIARILFKKCDFSLKLLIWPDFAKFSKILKKFDKTSPKRRLSAPLRGAAARGLEEILPCSGE